MTHNDKVMLIVFGLEVVCLLLFIFFSLCERKNEKKERIAQKERRLNWILSLNFSYKVYYMEEEWDELKEIFQSK